VEHLPSIALHFVTTNLSPGPASQLVPILCIEFHAIHWLTWSVYYQSVIYVQLVQLISIMMVVLSRKYNLKYYSSKHNIKFFLYLCLSHKLLCLVFLVCFYIQFFLLVPCKWHKFALRWPFMPLLPTVHTGLFVFVYLWYVKQIIIIITKSAY